MTKKQEENLKEKFTAEIRKAGEQGVMFGYREMAKEIQSMITEGCTLDKIRDFVSEEIELSNQIKKVLYKKD